MKPKFLLFPSLIFVALLVVSCSKNTIDADAKRIGDLTCKSMQLMKKALTGDESVLAESQKLSQEAEALKTELEAKYTSDSDKTKLAEAIAKAMNDCK
jgi:hypothetical protein